MEGQKEHVVNAGWRVLATDVGIDLADPVLQISLGQGISMGAFDVPRFAATSTRS